MKPDLSINSCDDLIGHVFHWRMYLHSEEALANENVENKTHKN